MLRYGLSFHNITLLMFPKVFHVRHVQPGLQNFLGLAASHSERCKSDYVKMITDDAVSWTILWDVCSSALKAFKSRATYANVTYDRILSVTCST